MANVKISNFPVPIALPVAAAINGTETLPMDQTNGGVVTTVSSLFSRLLGSLSVTYPTGVVTAAAGFTVSAGATLLQSTTITPTAASNGLIINPTSVSTQPGLNVKAIDGSGGIVLDAQSAVNGVFMSFKNSGTERGFIGTGPATLAGAALGDFTIGADTGVMRVVAGTGTSIGFNIGASPVANLILAGSTIFSGGGATLTLSAAGANRLSVSDTTNSIINAFGTNSTTSGFLGTQTAHPLDIRSSNLVRATVAAGGAITIFAPTSGAALTVNGLSGQKAVQVVGVGAAFAQSISGSTAEQLFIDNTANGVGTAGLRIDVSATTGTGTPTFANNKPTASSATATWLPININGAIRYIPCWA